MIYAKSNILQRGAAAWALAPDKNVARCLCEISRVVAAKKCFSSIIMGLMAASCLLGAANPQALFALVSRKMRPKKTTRSG